MVKHLKGKKYNTETALFIGSFSSCPPSETNGSYHQETLYKKKTGEFFLLCEGSEAREFENSCGCSSNSENWEITPITYEAAKNWAEKYLHPSKALQNIFGKIQGSNSRTVISVSLNSSVYLRAKQLSSKRGITLSRLIEQALEKEQAKNI